jgi:predicted transcriptional regulator
MTNAAPPQSNRNSEYEKSWTFITKHAAVLSLLANHPRITGREISREVGITERSVRIIIRDLEKSGYISKTREGRGIQYRVDSTRNMRKRDVSVSDLLSILSAKRSSLKKGIA